MLKDLQLRQETIKILGHGLVRSLLAVQEGNERFVQKLNIQLLAFEPGHNTLHFQ